MKGVRVAFALLLAGAAAFILFTGLSLPPVVASHFDGAGVPDGFMSRGAYIALMLALVIGIPLAMALIPRLLDRLPARYINVPYREYWLAPERRGRTLASLGAHLMLFAWVLTIFLAFVHWLVVEANRDEPPRLASEWLVPALIGFVIVTVMWIAFLFRRFPRPR